MWLHFHPGFSVSKFLLFLTVLYRLSITVGENEDDRVKKSPYKPILGNCPGPGPVPTVLFAQSHFILTATLKSGAIIMSILQSKKLRHR